MNEWNEMIEPHCEKVWKKNATAMQVYFEQYSLVISGMPA